MKKIGPVIYSLTQSMLATAHIFKKLTIVEWLQQQTVCNEF